MTTIAQVQNTHNAVQGVVVILLVCMGPCVVVCIGALCSFAAVAADGGVAAIVATAAATDVVVVVVVSVLVVVGVGGVDFL